MRGSRYPTDAQSSAPGPRGGLRLVVLVLLTASCIGCDQVTKRVASESLRHEGILSYAGGVVRLQYAENTGAFLGWGASLSDAARFWILTIATAALLAGVGFVLVTRRNLRTGVFLALALVLAGGLGNLIDRISSGFVVDFVSLGIGSLRTGIFNVADVAITAGAAWLLWDGFRGRGEPET